MTGSCSKMNRKFTCFLIVLGFILLVTGLMGFLYSPSEYSKEEIQSFKEELRRVRDKYAIAARLYGPSSPEANLLNAECHRLEDLESELNDRESANQVFRSFGASLLLISILLLGVGFVKCLQ